MTIERDPMTMNEISVPALGVEERSEGAAQRFDKGQILAISLHGRSSLGKGRQGGR